MFDPAAAVTDLCVFAADDDAALRLGSVGVADEEVSLHLVAVVDLETHHLTALLQDSCTAHKQPYHITHCDTYAFKHGSYLMGAARVTSANRMCTIKRSVTTRATCHLIITPYSD